MAAKFFFNGQEFSSAVAVARYATSQPGAKPHQVVTYQVRKDLHLSHTYLARERVPGLVAQILGLIDDLAQEINPQKEEEPTQDDGNIIRYAVLQHLEQCYPTIEFEEERHVSLRSGDFK